MGPLKRECLATIRAQLVRGGGRAPVASMAMLERLADLEREYDDVLARLADPEVLADQRARVTESRRHKQLEPIVSRYRAYRSALDDLEVAKELGMRDEAAETEARIAAL